MRSRTCLFEIADRQQGFFTAQQAVEAGYSRSNFHLKLEAGEWTNEGRGLYRLSQYPATDRPELVQWTLWSRNRKGIPQGVWSHQTALDIHDLSDVMPSKMHMTVPNSFRRRAEVPNVLRLHHSDLLASEIEARQGFRVTTPLRTLIDIVVEGVVNDDFVAQALHQALHRGLISREDLKGIENVDPDIQAQLMRFLHDNNF